ncbi:MAG: hypothetical protein R3281_12990 [Balneolaceae bacterium]|nr:hypothetical protein [Balneolaceae bacterium]
MKLLFITIIASSLFIPACNPFVTNVDTEDRYPTVLEKISEQKQMLLQEAFEKANPGLCAEINKYGLNGNKICNDREVARKIITDDDEQRLIAEARKFLTRNAKFTNVRDSGELVVRKSVGLSGCLACDGSEGDRAVIGWKVSFDNQRLNGLEIKDSSIDVFMDSENVFQVYGHWYPHVVVPELGRLDAEAVKDTLLGKELRYSDWTGEKTHVITEESFGEFEEKAIIPYETDRGLELRVCLGISVGKIWHIYVDNTTGEIIRKEQQINF